MKKRKNEEEITEIEVDDDEFDIDEDDDIVDIADDEDEVADEPTKPTSNKLEDMLNETLSKQLKAQHKKTTAYVDKRIQDVRQELKSHANQLVDHDKRITDLEEVLSAVPVMNNAKPQKVERVTVVDKTLGAVGDILHGTLDTVAFVGESVIDLATFGKARRR